MKPCNRCGLCCTIELCSKGRRSDRKVKGRCKYLIKHNDNTASCQLVIEGKMKSQYISLGEGCVIQENYPKMYEFQMEYRKVKKGY